MTDTPQIPVAMIPEPAPRSARAGMRTVLIALVLLLLAGTLRWYKLGERDVWIDEANGVLMARQSLPVLIDRLKLDSSPPLYYVALKAWMAVFGETEAAIRGLSLLGGLALTLSVLVLGRRWFSLEVGVLAALLLATSPIQIYYSQQARMYAWLPVAALWSLHWLGRAIREGHARHLVAYALCTLAALYTHNYGLYLLPAHTAIVMAARRRIEHPGRWAACGLAVILGYLPWTPVLLEQLQNETHYKWFLPYWREFGVFGALWATVQSFAPGGRQPLYVALRGVPAIGPYATALFAALFALGGLTILRCSRRRVSTVVVAGEPSPGPSLEGRRVGALYAATLLPLVLALLASTILTPNYVPGRCDQLALPLFLMGVALGLRFIRPAFLRYLVVAGLLAFSTISLRSYYYRPFVLSERALALDIAHRAAPDDAVLCLSLTRGPLEYYCERYKIPIRLYSYPSGAAEHLGNQDDGVLMADPAKLRDEAHAVIQTIRDAHGPQARFFLVTEHYATERGLVPGPVDRVFYNELMATGKLKQLAIVGKYAQAGTGQPVVATYVQVGEK